MTGCPGRKWGLMSKMVSLLAEAGNFLANFKHLVQPNELLFLSNVFTFFQWTSEKLQKPASIYWGFPKGDKVIGSNDVSLIKRVAGWEDVSKGNVVSMQLHQRYSWLSLDSRKIMASMCYCWEFHRLRWVMC